MKRTEKITIFRVSIALCILIHLSSLHFKTAYISLKDLIKFCGDNQLVTTVILFLPFNMRLKEQKNEILVPSLIFSFFTIIGKFFKFAGGMDCLFDYSIENVLFDIICLYGFFNLYCFLLEKFWWLFSREGKVTNFDLFVFEKAPLLICTSIIFLCWIPYYLADYPGTITFDGFSQIDQALGIHPLTNAHPVFSTFLIGLCMKVGRCILNDNFGVFLYVFIQGVFLAGSFGYVFVAMKQLKVPMIWRRISLLFFACFSEWPAFAHCVIKDTLYVAFFVLFNVTLIMLYIKEKEDKVCSSLKGIFLVIFALLISLIRHNGLYIVLLTSVFFLFIVRSKKWLILSIVSVIVSSFTINIIIKNAEIEQSSIREILSIPFQQTARFVSLHENDVTDEDIEIIDRVLKYEDLSKNYNPELSDPVKGLFRNTADNKDVLQYFSVWYKHFLKHPLTYFSATIHNSYGYYSLEVPMKGMSDEYNIDHSEKVDTGILDINFVSPLYISLGALIRLLRYDLSNLPGFSLLYSLGLYTWLIIASSFYICNKECKMRYFFSMIPVILTIIGCIGSPVNAYHSYMLPVLAMCPLIVGMALPEQELTSDISPSKFLIKSVVCLIIMLSIALNMKQIILYFSDDAPRKVDFETYISNSEGKANIDILEVHDEYLNRYSLTGWAFCKTEFENSNKAVTLLFKSRTSDDCYAITDNTITIRSDVYEVFANDYNLSNKMHGFSPIFSIINMEEDVYDLYIYVWENEESYCIIDMDETIVIKDGILLIQ